jgi:hypothetical protein
VAAAATNSVDDSRVIHAQQISANVTTPSRTLLRLHRPNSELAAQMLRRIGQQWIEPMFRTVLVAMAATLAAFTLAPVTHADPDDPDPHIPKYGRQLLP